MTDNPPRGTHIALVPRWVLDAATFPTTPDEIEAVARLRFGQVVRLPTAEREALSRLLWASDPTPYGGQDRQKGPTPWH